MGGQNGAHLELPGREFRLPGRPRGRRVFLRNDLYAFVQKVFEPVNPGGSTSSNLVGR
jgi:hypothetical protein